MSTRSYILAASALAIALPLHAQPAAAPDDKGADTAAIAIGELEQKIGGRTTLELKFEGATPEQVASAIAASSGLRVKSELDLAGGLLHNVQGGGPLYNADVARADLWPALRAWSLSEDVRLRAERLAELRKREVQAPEPPPAGLAPGSAEEKAWKEAAAQRAERRIWSQMRYGPGSLMSASFDTPGQRLVLRPGTDLITGRAQSHWPCMVLATGFQRHQSLSISEGEVGQAAAKAEGEPQVLAAEDDGSGPLSDSLTLGMAVYLEPRLLAKAKLSFRVSEARGEAGEDLLDEREKNQSAQSRSPSSGSFGSGGPTMVWSVLLKPRESKGTRLALLRGVVQVRYPMQAQAREVTDFSGPQSFPIATRGLQAQISIEPPQLVNGRWSVHSVARGNFKTGWRSQMQPQMRKLEPLFGESPLPAQFTFTDALGRTWRATNAITLLNAGGPHDPTTLGGSPPPPRPDDFTYTEGSEAALELMLPDNPRPPATVGAPGAPSSLRRTATEVYITSGGSRFTVPTQLSPEELAQVRFTRATFTTESDWRTLEVPFEFRDLPLPPR